MIDWKKCLIDPGQSVRDAIEKIDKSGLQIALVVDEQHRLLGTVTDGDVRRAILKGSSLDTAVSAVMKKNPNTVTQDSSDDVALAAMKARGVRHMPIVDKQGIIQGLKVLEELRDRPPRLENCAVLVAGGMGSRLKHLTKDCPKPMLKVGGKPIIETILENMIAHGICRFFVSVNYKAEMVKEHLGDGRRWGVEISYLHEEQRLGTGGALSLLTERPAAPLLVMNADLLTNVNFYQLLNFHKEHKAKATMCVREYDFQVPFGVVKLDHHRLVGIEEKPFYKFFVNAGIYVLEPEMLDLIPRGTYYDMPTLFQEMVSRKLETITFPIREYWLDIGQATDFERANGEFGEVFP